MAFAENRGSYWRGRYKIEHGKYETVKDESGRTVRFRTKREAEQAAEAAEAEVRKGKLRNLSLGRTTFGEYASRWYAAQDLAVSTMQNYKRHIEEHLLPTFEASAMADIKATDIGAWEKGQRAVGYAESSIRTWRATLHLILADAVEEGLRESNPASRRRGRGRRAGRVRHRGSEKVVTTALGILLIAERAALLSGRDDEFVAVITMGYTGMRWGELVGLETCFVRPAEVRVEWQLYELDSGELHRCPPKDDSQRSLDWPEWLAKLVTDHLARARPRPCVCHERTYVFGGHRPPPGAARSLGPTIADVARLAGVSTATVSASWNHPDVVASDTQDRIARAIAELGYVRGGAAATLAPHSRRSNFATWLFQPAATGYYPSKGGRLRSRPVPILGEPWPGIPVRGSQRGGSS